MKLEFGNPEHIKTAKGGEISEKAICGKACPITCGTDVKSDIEKYNAFNSNFQYYEIRKQKTEETIYIFNQ
jgi:hypothetical protein